MNEDARVRGRAPQPRRFGRRALIVTGAVVLVLILGYAVTFAPGHYARVSAETTTGEAIDLGHGAAAIPVDRWSVEPRVTDLVTLPAPLPALTSWSVVTADAGRTLRTPDGVLTVELAGHAGAGADAEALLEAAVASLPAEAAESASDLRTETLASGLTLRHVDLPGEIVAVVGDDAPVLVHARAVTGEVEAYRPALSALLESITEGRA